MIQNYTRDFCKELDKDFNKDSSVFDCSPPPVVCFTKQGINERGELIDGVFNSEKWRIEIMNITREKPEEIKRTIRHECLHFFLYKNGLPYRDKDIIFLELATIYNARPYGVLSISPEKLKELKQDGYIITPYIEELLRPVNDTDLNSPPRVESFETKTDARKDNKRKQR